MVHVFIHSIKIFKCVIYIKFECKLCLILLDEWQFFINKRKLAFSISLQYTQVPKDGYNIKMKPYQPRMVTCAKCIQKWDFCMCFVG